MDHRHESALPRFLRRLLLRSELSAEERSAILSLHGHAVDVPAHRDLIVPGQNVGYSCLVADGVVGRFDQMLDGSRQTTSFFIAGDMADLQSTVWPIAGWGIAALTHAVVLQIPHAALIDLANRYPAIAKAFWRDTTVDAAILAKWVANIGRKSARARIAHVLCEMGRRIEEAGLGTRTRFRFAITQDQLGDAMGLTPVHVNRTLRSLREEGAVDFRHSEVEVLDLTLLQRIAEFDPLFLLLETA